MPNRKSFQRFSQTFPARAEHLDEREAIILGPRQGGDAAEGSHEYLDHLMRKLKRVSPMSDPNRGDIYCGYAGYEPTSRRGTEYVEFGEYSVGGGSSPLVLVGSGTVRGMAAAVGPFLAMPQFACWVLRLASQEDDNAAQKAYDRFRASVCAAILRAIGDGETAAEVADDTDLFDQFSTSDNIELLGRGAVAWVVAHELGHLAGGSQPGVSPEAGTPWTPELLPEVFLQGISDAQSGEYAADLWSHQAIMQSDLSSTEKYQVWPAGIILGAVMGLAEFELDDGQIHRTEQDAHPNPFRRSTVSWWAFFSVVKSFCAAASQAEADSLLQDAANAYVFTRVVAGEYSAEHRGFASLPLDMQAWAEMLRRKVEE